MLQLAGTEPSWPGEYAAWAPPGILPARLGHCGAEQAAPALVPSGCSASGGQFQETTQEYLAALRDCLFNSSALREQAAKHFATASRGGPYVGFDEALYIWAEVHAHLGKPFGPEGHACLERLYVERVGFPGQAWLAADGFEFFFRDMLQALRPMLQTPMVQEASAEPSPQGMKDVLVSRTPVPTSAPAPAPASLGENGRYLVERRLGGGTCGEVFKATEKGTGRRVAVKRVTRNSEALLEEFAVLQGLEHPNVLTATECFEGDDCCYVVTEFIPGGSLADHLRSEAQTGRVTSEPWASEVLHQALAAVAYCHGVGVVHNDLKPENILLASPDGARPRVVVSDFGLAKPACQGSDVPPGDPRYAPPEAWEENWHQSHQAVNSSFADVWMLGCTLFEMLSGGHLPFLVHRNPGLAEFHTWLCKDMNFRYTWVMSLKQNEPNWQTVAAAGAGPRSEAALDLCGQMLAKDPHQRPTCAACAVHPWFEEQRCARRQVGESQGSLLAEEARRRILANASGWRRPAATDASDAGDQAPAPEADSA